MNFTNDTIIVSRTDFAWLSNICTLLPYEGRNVILTVSDPEGDYTLPNGYQRLFTSAAMPEPSDTIHGLLFKIQPKQQLSWINAHGQMILVMHPLSFHRLIQNIAERERVAASTYELRPGRRDGYVEIRFGGKPAEDVRTELKAAEYRWARSNGCWFGLRDKLPQRFQEKTTVIEDEAIHDPVSEETFEAVVDTADERVDTATQPTRKKKLILKK